MQRRKLIVSIIFLLLIVSLILGGIIWYSSENQKLKVIFLDVGQGDAILITEGSNQILIDGGKNGKLLLEKLGNYIPFWDRQIETVVATHPDQDHIGGLISALKAYKVNSVIETREKSVSETYKSWEEVVSQENTEKIEALPGVTIKLPKGGEAKVIYPFSSLSESGNKDSNENSIVIQLAYNNNKFLFTGDLQNDGEQELLSKNTELKSNILKVAHHGSKYSTSEEFLKKVEPREAVISVGANNSYGHPSQETLDRLQTQGAKIRRTDQEGDIIYEY